MSPPASVKGSEVWIPVLQAVCHGVSMSEFRAHFIHKGTNRLLGPPQTQNASTLNFKFKLLELKAQP